MIAAAREAVPWTRPGELPVRRGKPVSGLDDADDKGVLVGIVDGTVRYVPRGDQALLRKLITHAGGEVIDLARGLAGLTPAGPAGHCDPTDHADPDGPPPPTP